MKDFKETLAVFAYIVIFIPWLLMTIVYQPFDRFMRSCAKHLDVE